MQCRNCGTEIAERAIVCFRCGQGTTDPVRKPVPVAAGPSGGRGVVIGGVVALVAALPLLIVPEATPVPEAARAAGTVLAGAGGLGLFIGLIGLVRRR